MSFIPIQVAVCEHFGFTLPELVSKDRHKSIVFARQLAVYLCRTILGLSYPELGRAFGRDHTTMIHAARKAETLLSADAVAAAHMRSILTALGSEQAPPRQQAPSMDYRISEAS